MIRSVFRSKGYLREASTYQAALQTSNRPRYISIFPPLRKEDESGKVDEDFSLLSSGGVKKETERSAESLPGAASSSSSPSSTLTAPASSINPSSNPGISTSKQNAKDDKAQTKGNTPIKNQNAWAEIMKTLNMTTPGRSGFTDNDYSDTTRLHTPSSNEPLDPKISFEEQWKVRQVNGPLAPAKPKDGRTADVRNDADVARGYSALSSIMSRNNVRYELRLGERYEKPNQTRRRLRSERHRRRFAEAVREKVRLVMELKSRGA